MPPIKGRQVVKRMEVLVITPFYFVLTTRKADIAADASRVDVVKLSCWHSDGAGGVVKVITTALRTTY